MFLNRIGPAKFQLIMFSFVLISASKDSQVLRVCHLSLHILAYQILKYNQEVLSWYYYILRKGQQQKI